MLHISIQSFVFHSDPCLGSTLVRRAPELDSVRPVAFHHAEGSDFGLEWSHSHANTDTVARAEHDASWGIWLPGLEHVFRMGNRVIDGYNLGAGALEASNFHQLFFAPCPALAVPHHRSSGLVHDVIPIAQRLRGFCDLTGGVGRVFHHL